MKKFIVFTLLTALLAATLANIMNIHSSASGVDVEVTNQEKERTRNEIRAGVMEANYKLCQAHYEVFTERMAYLNDAFSNKRVGDCDKYLNLTITAFENVKSTCVYTIMKEEAKL